MKSNEYERLVIDVIEFEQQDVITDSCTLYSTECPNYTPQIED